MFGKSIFALAVSCACGQLAFTAHAEQVTFPMTMTGPEETGAGDVDGTASGTITFDTVTNEISWSFTFANIVAPTSMHIHNAPAGAGAGVFVGLGVATTGGAGTLISSVTTTAANISAILANPIGFYVNIHNGPFPSGAVRGQIPAMFELMMTGPQEVPGPGDADGTAMGMLGFDTGVNEIFWDFTFANIVAPTAMHIHNAPAGMSAGVFVGLGVATTGGAGTLISSVTTTPANIAAVLAAPTDFYVNIHNGPFPGGAVRGQIEDAPAAPCPADLNGDGSVGSGDLANLLGSWGPCPAPPATCAADFGMDGSVGSGDLATLLGSWGPCP